MKDKRPGSITRLRIGDDQGFIFLCIDFNFHDREILYFSLHEAQVFSDHLVKKINEVKESDE